MWRNICRHVEHTASSRRGQLTEEEVRLILWQMLMALKFLHSINVWHRDIKSSNVLLARAKGHRIVKVTGQASTMVCYVWHCLVIAILSGIGGEPLIVVAFSLSSLVSINAAESHPAVVWLPGGHNTA